MESISPNIFVKDLERTIEFYKQIGFNTVMTVSEEGDLVWAMMNSGSVNFMFQTFDSLGAEIPEISRQDGGSLLLYIRIKEIMVFHEQIKGSEKLNLEMLTYKQKIAWTLTTNVYIVSGGCVSRSRTGKQIRSD